MQPSSSETRVSFKENTGASLSPPLHASLFRLAPPPTFRSASPSLHSALSSPPLRPSESFPCNLAASRCAVVFPPLGGRAAFHLGSSLDSPVNVQLKKGYSMQM